MLPTCISQNKCNGDGATDEFFYDATENRSRSFITLDLEICKILASVVVQLALSERSSSIQLGQQTNRMRETKAALIALAGCATALDGTLPSGYPSPWGTGGVGWDDAYAKAKEFVSQLTLTEKVNLTSKKPKGSS